MRRGRRISFDYGDVRIGVAVSDPDSILVSPLTTLKTSSKDLLGQISQILDEYEPIAIYIGLPSQMSGMDGIATQKVREFSEKMKAVTEVEINFVDERLSTVSAARNLRESGKNTRDSKNSIDMAAAVEILNFAIEIEKAQR